MRTKMPDWNSDIAPIDRNPPIPKPWEGVQETKPWDYNITAGIVHKDTPELLQVVIESLRAQTERPYICIADTGSNDKTVEYLKELEKDEDVEISYVRSKGWKATSHPVSSGMDLITSMCRTPYLYSTHTDVFIKRPDYLEFLMGKCSKEFPVIGYQMSNRTQWGFDEWKRVISHTGSIYRMKSMQEYSVTWNVLSAFSRLGVEPGIPQQCYPDTEGNLCMVMESNGYNLVWPDSRPESGMLCLGDEPNAPYETFWLSHVRSFSTAGLYCKGTDYFYKRKAIANGEVQKSRSRVSMWKTYPPTKITYKDVEDSVLTCKWRGPRVDSESGHLHKCIKYGKKVRIDPDCMNCIFGCENGSPKKWSTEDGLML